MNKLSKIGNVIFKNIPKKVPPNSVIITTNSNVASWQLLPDKSKINLVTPGTGNNILYMDGDKLVQNTISAGRLINIPLANSNYTINYKESDKIYIIDAGGNGDYTTITAATTAQPGATFILKPGTYTENVILDDQSIYGQGFPKIDGIVTFQGSGTLRSLQVNSAVINGIGADVYFDDVNVNSTVTTNALVNVVNGDLEIFNCDLNIVQTAGLVATGILSSITGTVTVARTNINMDISGASDRYVVSSSAGIVNMSNNAITSTGTAAGGDLYIFNTTATMNTKGNYVVVSNPNTILYNSTNVISSYNDVVTGTPTFVSTLMSNNVTFSNLTYFNKSFSNTTSIRLTSNATLDYLSLLDVYTIESATIPLTIQLPNPDVRFVGTKITIRTKAVSADITITTPGGAPVFYDGMNATTSTTTLSGNYKNQIYELIEDNGNYYWLVL